MRRSKDPLTAACTSILTPFLKRHGFKRATTRTYAREQDGTLQFIVVDANGFGGAKRTLFTLMSKFIFDTSPGYWERAGFRLCDGMTWNMSQHQTADEAMIEVVEALRKTELEKLCRLSTAERLLSVYREHSLTSYERLLVQVERWRAGDQELIASANTNRQKYKLGA